MSEQKSTTVTMDTRASVSGSHAASTACQCLGCTISRGELAAGDRFTATTRVTGSDRGFVTREVEGRFLNGAPLNASGDAI